MTKDCIYSYCHRSWHVRVILMGPKKVYPAKYSRVLRNDLILILLLHCFLGWQTPEVEDSRERTIVCFESKPASLYLYGGRVLAEHWLKIADCSLKYLEYVNLIAT
ncbi:hypothetical protein M514_05925 [Trichuris suis]|uniref:Uncharacterized protein n=1 Tax=Trichuris suis TaxID=68888 RepID=A0A085M7L9_9BILA|nr:hypothetical protein M513_05925 [Trichuris suis]KFD65573.1 hypothetical protein M514_05925 [Trichuris suis]